MRILDYLRVSTEKQEVSGLGLEAQKHACNQWRIDAKMEHIEVLEFVDIVTGTDRKRKELEERPKLLEALAMLQQGDILLVQKRDRLGRDPYVNCMIERIIEKKKGKLVSANGEMDGDQPHDILMRRMIDAFAEYEGMLISSRVHLALQRKKARGERVGKIPYGYRLESKGNIQIDPIESQTLEKMYAFRMKDRKNLREIAQALNSEGLYNRPTKRRKQVPWTHGAVARVYENHLLVAR